MPGCEVTFIRASTTILRIGGRIVVTDPWFSMRMRLLPALVRPGLPLSRMPVPDVVLCSHLHADHFEPAAIRRMAGPGTVVVGPPGTAAALRGRTRSSIPLHGGTGRNATTDAPGIPRVVELEPHGENAAEIAGLSITAYRIPHTFPPPDENGYVLSDGGTTVFFGGDGAYGPVYAEVGRRHAIDLALLPVGGSLILGRRTVMSPDQAVQAALDLGAKALVPLHPGGEWLPLPPLSWHPGRGRHAQAVVRRRGLDLRVHVLPRGETAVLI